jgi:hypothetical protein
MFCEKFVPIYQSTRSVISSRTIMYPNGSIEELHVDMQQENSNIPVEFSKDIPYDKTGKVHCSILISVHGKKLALEDLPTIFLRHFFCRCENCKLLSIN